MLADQVLNMAGSVMEQAKGMLPEWNTGMDGEQLRQLISVLAGWNNWLPLSELVICLGVAAAIWAGGHVANTIRQGVKGLLEALPL